jgi:hypothetical protein
MKQGYRMIRWLMKLMKDAHFPASINCRSEYCSPEQLLIDSLTARKRKENAS